MEIKQIVKYIAILILSLALIHFWIEWLISSSAGEGISSIYYVLYCCVWIILFIIFLLVIYLIFRLINKACR
jgi:flagellar biosynthesis protein FlhB